MSTPAGPPLDQLLEHRAWVRGLVRTLVLDRSTADDVEQQVWMSALKSAPAEVAKPRAWLAAVARNWVRRGRRGASRRGRREAAVARPEGDASTVDLVERADAHRRVVAAVLALSQPLREAVLLHYFDGLGVREAAARANVPVETLRSRLRLARERLRQALAEPNGRSGAAAWSPALLALGDLPRHAAAGSAGSAIGGTLTMTLANKAAVAVVVPLAIGAAWVTARSAAPEPGMTGAEARELVARIDRLEKAREATPPANDSRALARRLDALEMMIVEVSQRQAPPQADAGSRAPRPAQPAPPGAEKLVPEIGGLLAEIVLGLQSPPGSKEHRDALRRLADHLIKKSGPPPEGEEVAAATALLEREARAKRVSVEEADEIAGLFHALAPGHTARAGLAVAVAGGWAHDDRLAGFLGGIAANADPQSHQMLVRVLDHEPGPGFGEYVLRLLREERDPSVLRSFLDPDRVAAALPQVGAARMVEAIETRVAEGKFDRKMRERAARGLAVAGLSDRDVGARSLDRMAATEPDAALAAKIRQAADALRQGRGTEKEFERLFD